MAGIDFSTTSTPLNDGVLQLENGVAMDSTLRNVADQLNTTSPLKLSTALVQVQSTLKITTQDDPYIDAEDGAGNNRFQVGRDPSSQVVNIDFASNPTGGTNQVGAIRTYTDGVNLAQVMSFRKDGNIGINTSSPTAKTHIVGSGSTSATTSLLVQNNAGATSLQITDSNLLCLGGTTSSFPAIKRNGTAIDFRLADDSGFCGINASRIGIGSAVSLTENTGTAGWNTSLGNVTANVGSLSVFSFNNISDSSTSGTSNYVRVNKSITPNTGSANFNNFIVNYDIAASGSQTGTTTGILLNATETNLNGMTHNLVDLKVGVTSQFKITSSGIVRSNNFQVNNGGYYGVGGGSFLQFNSDGMGLISAWNGGWNRLQFGGTTSSFPSIKRNGTEIDFRLADDSAFTAVNATIFRVGGTATQLQVNQLNLGGFNAVQLSTRIYFDGDNRGSSFGGAVSMASSNVAPNASAQLDVVSTTKGFLPPRMTDAQVRAIVAPADGLVVYNTDINHLCCYQAGAWVKFSHTPM